MPKNSNKTGIRFQRDAILSSPFLPRCVNKEEIVFVGKRSKVGSRPNNGKGLLERGEREEREANKRTKGDDLFVSRRNRKVAREKRCELEKEEGRFDIPSVVIGLQKIVVVARASLSSLLL